MFAGAAREVVFSNPAVVRNIQTRFVPVALKAGLVNNPPAGIEGDLYGEINRTRAAPQGICIMNSAGKVLDWVLSFDNEQAMSEFLNYAVDRYKNHPADKHAVATRRHRRYPSVAMSDVADTGTVFKIAERHVGQRCPATRDVPSGTLVGRVIGRPLDARGELIAETLRQEDYMEARLEVSTPAQRLLVDAFRTSKSPRFRVPDAFARELVGPAYLGQLDVSPLDYVPGSENTARWWEFFAEPIEDEADGSVRLRVTGRSHIAANGRRWNHTVSLDWQGYVDLRGDYVGRLDMIARGQERLQWHVGDLALATAPAANLMAGHPIDLDSGVTYGLRAETSPP